MQLNFTLQDIFSLLVAIILFSSVFVFPGYVIGWAANIFSFKHRTLFAQYVIALALSNALIPIILFLAFRLFSNQFGVGIIILFFILWTAIQFGFQKKNLISFEVAPWHKMALAMGGIWILFCIVLLVDIQVGQRLYFNAAAHDFTTRVAIIEAITRTGVPPINPGYYPGHFVKIDQLYYFWYIPPSVVDILGGKWVDARAALFAGITWSGLALMGTVATYLRVRNPQSGQKAWRASLIGSQLLAVSGLDFVPVIALMIAVRTMSGIIPFDGRIEGWNMPIMSWLNAITWVPNHVSGMAACMISVMAILTGLRATRRQRVLYLLIAGFSIGSAFGLSIWVAFTFGIFMAVWGVAALFNRSQRILFWFIIVSGILGLILASPFLMRLVPSRGTSVAGSGLPIGLYVRPFSFTHNLPSGIRDVVALFLLPLNYFFELGFFFVIALLWFKLRRKSAVRDDNPYFLVETILLITVAILMSFVKSTVIAFNDLGMRGWLLGQFVLIIWSVDIFNSLQKDQSFLRTSTFKSSFNSKRLNDLLAILLIVGIMTTTLEAVTTRFWAILVDAGVTGVPNEISPDTNLGKRTYDARVAYEYIRDHTPQNMIIQNNPIPYLDRPSGLYGTRQMVIADRTAYGVPKEIFQEMTRSIGQIFLADHVSNWVPIDKICTQYSIQAIVLNDTDPLWSSLRVLLKQRMPLYMNQHYALFSCGN